MVVVIGEAGYLLDGSKFDASYERGKPLSFRLGAGSVIEGWDEGVSTMKIGGRRVLLVPPDLAYGRKGAGGGRIPPNTPLVFFIELLSVSA